MGTIDQPKPTQPKSPQPDQQPLQPGGTQANPARPNIQTPDTQKEKSGSR